MIISENAGLITALRKAPNSMVTLGSITVIERIVMTMQQVGIFPIVVVTGEDASELRYCLASYGVIFLHYDDYRNAEKFDGVKAGVAFLKGRSKRIVYASLHVPFVSPRTIETLLESRGEVVRPSFEGAGGHPVIFSENVFDEILHYSGEEGLRGALRQLKGRDHWVNIIDAGLKSNSAKEGPELRAHAHNEALLQPVLDFAIAKDKKMLDARGKLLLYLITALHSVRQAAFHMALSYSKAWEIINHLEDELGFQVVHRKHGGSRGGRTDLTERGYQLLEAFLAFERKVMRFAREQFQSDLVERHIFERYE